MRAMLLKATGSLDVNPVPLELEEIDDPAPADDEILIRVAACGVCHTELDEIEGRTPPPKLPVVPGHEVVGRVMAAGDKARRFRQGDRVGVGWIHSSDGTDTENISPAFRATGRDVNGGYAELMTVPEGYAAPVPDVFGDVEGAMSAGIPACLVRTGKYRPGDEDRIEGEFPVVDDVSGAVDLVLAGVPLV